MGGDMALSFVRARHCQYMDNSTWVSEAESSLARIRRRTALHQNDGYQGACRRSERRRPAERHRWRGGPQPDSRFRIQPGSALPPGPGPTTTSSPNNSPWPPLPTGLARVGGNDVPVAKQPGAQAAVNRFVQGEGPPLPAVSRPRSPRASGFGCSTAAGPKARRRWSPPRYEAMASRHRHPELPPSASPRPSEPLGSPGGGSRRPLRPSACDQHGDKSEAHHGDPTDGAAPHCAVQKNSLHDRRHM